MIFDIIGALITGSIFFLMFEAIQKILGTPHGWTAFLAGATLSLLIKIIDLVATQNVNVEP